MQAWFGDGVTGRALVVVGFGVGSGQGSHGRDEEGRERTHFDCLGLFRFWLTKETIMMDLIWDERKTGVGDALSPVKE